MPLADRLERVSRSAEALEGQYSAVQAEAAEAFQPLDIYDMYDFDDEAAGMADAAICLHMAAVKLSDAAHAAQHWLDQLQGRALTVPQQLHAMLREAQQAQQDVLIYYEVV